MRDIEGRPSTLMSWDTSSDQQVGMTHQVVPADLSITVPASSHVDVAMACRMFLDRNVTASVSKLPCEDGETWRVSAIVFLDFAPLHIEMRTRVLSGDVTLITARHSSRSDVVRFKRVSELLVESLRISGFKVQYEQGDDDNAHHARQPQPINDDFEDFLDDATAASWFERVELVMAGFDSRIPSTREEAIQCLARWALCAPASHLVLAEALSERSERIGKIFFAKRKAPLEVMYPMAVTLRTLVCGQSPEARAVLLTSPYAEIMDKYKRSITGLPPLVANDLSSVVQNMKEGSVQKPYPEESFGFSTLTTCSSEASFIQRLREASTVSPKKLGADDEPSQKAGPNVVASNQMSTNLRKMVFMTEHLFEPTRSCS